eukprot:8275867-Pyramimonas_sp.AAC.1
MQDNARQCKTMQDNASPKFALSDCQLRPSAHGDKIPPQYDTDRPHGAHQCQPLSSMLPT